MKKVVRLNERELTRLIKNIVLENPVGVGQMCVKDTPNKSRPLCSELSVGSGNLLAMGDTAFLQYKDNANCPKLCRVNNNTPVTIS